MAILSKPCKQINLNCTTLKLSFTNVPGLHSNSVDCKFFLESNSPDILALCEKTWMTQLILAISLQEIIFL